MLRTMLRYERTNKSDFGLAGRSLVFWDFKKPPEKMIPQLNRYPHSKAPMLGEGRGEGRVGCQPCSGGGGGGVGRGQTLLKL